MSNKFDLERAKSGEPVEYLTLTEWVPVHFVGADKHGCPVGQRFDGGFFVPDRYQDYLRMAPKKVKVRYRVAMFRSVFGHHSPFVISTQSDEEAEAWEKKNTGFDRWLTGWNEYEGPQ